jgi:hypothetical protein
MENILENIGLVSNIKIVEDYIVSTGRKINSQEVMDELDQFAIWIVCNILPLPE